MSITISTIAADARTRSRRPVEARFDAVSSALGAVSPAAMSARAFSTGFAYSMKERHSAAAAPVPGEAHDGPAGLVQPARQGQAGGDRHAHNARHDGQRLGGMAEGQEGLDRPPGDDRQHCRRDHVRAAVEPLRVQGHVNLPCLYDKET